jgi:hypothetical protein
MRRWRSRLDAKFPQLTVVPQCRRIARWRRKAAVSRCKRRLLPIIIIPTPQLPVGRKPSWRMRRKPPFRRRVARTASAGAFGLQPMIVPPVPPLSVSGIRVRGLG